MCKLNIFFSYTIRDGLIDRKFLHIFKDKLIDLNFFNSYIDLIDNNSCIPQVYVLNKLKKSDIICVINTPYIYKSPWVKKELKLAKKYSIPILIISFNDVLNFIECSDSFSLYTSNLIINIANIIIKNKLI